jgi:hypothetical protein
MALRILDDTMSSDRSPHTARLAPGEQHTCEVSWLPGRRLNRNEAITAMVLADTTANGGVHERHRAWPHIEDWAAKIGMTGSQALARIAGPPRWASHQEKTAEPPDADPPDFERPDDDSLDLGWADADWSEPEYPDPSWPSFAPAGRRPVYMFNLAVSPWYKERYPDQPAGLWDVLRAGRDPQPAPEPDKLADREAGQ